VNRLGETSPGILISLLALDTYEFLEAHNLANRLQLPNNCYSFTLVSRWILAKLFVDK